MTKKKKIHKAEVQPEAVEPKTDISAVIDIGTTSLRMTIAQVDKEGVIHQLEAVSQGVELGKDTFTRGDISRSTTEECVEVLSSFKRLLQEYQITSEHQIRAVATSAVREAGNRQAFLDRVYVATGINVESIDEAEVNRYTYLSILPLIEKTPSLKKSDTLIAEVGGGSTEFLALHEGQVVAAQSHRLGSLRMREMLEDFRAPAVRERAILEEHIRRTVAQVSAKMGGKRGMSVLALGGEACFAASELLPKWDQKSVARVSVEKLSALTEKILKLPVDEIVSRYHLDYPSAETLGPALLSYLRLAEAFKRKFVKVAASTLRDGLLAEMAAQDHWIQQSRKQIIHSALELGRKYQFDEAHARNVADHCQQLFEALKDHHGFSTRHELILTVAALLHEIGLFVSNRSHHKHSLYLIRNSSLFGLGAKDLELAAIVARYHRRAVPRPTHEYYGLLDRNDRIAVSKLAAILRVADALNRGQERRLRDIEIQVEPKRLILTARKVADATLEQMALRTKSNLFERVYGMEVVLRATES